MKLYSKKKRKKTTNKWFKKRIDTHLLYTCKYFQMIYFLNFKIQIIIEILTKTNQLKNKEILIKF